MSDSQPGAGSWNPNAPGAQPQPEYPQSGYAQPPQAGSPQPGQYASPKDARGQAAAAKAYRKASRPFYKKKRFILLAIIVLIIIIIVIVSSGGGGSDSKAVASTCTGKTYPDQQKSDVCADSTGAVKISDVTITATPLAAITDQLQQAALCTDVTIKNGSTKSQDYNVLDFKVQTPGGDVATTSTLSLAGTLDSGTLIAGATKTGKVCTANTGQKGTYVFIYKPNPFSSTRGTWLFPVT